VLVLANFSEFEQHCSSEIFAAMPDDVNDLLGNDLVTIVLRQGLTLRPYQVVWLNVSVQ
jgi:hypothetical protein